MRISRDAIKSDAKLVIDQTTPSPILVGLIFMLVMGVLELLTYTVTGYSQYISQLTAQLMSFSDAPLANGSFAEMAIVPFVPTFDVFATILCIAIGLMSLMLTTGFIIFTLNAADRKKASYGNLLDGFGLFLKVVWLYIVTLAFTFLWTLLFIVPGIIASYRYRQAIYILLENPELSAMECINRSKAMMDGHKGELFVVDLSFIGWILLTIIPFVTIFVSPYRYITYANYYRALRDMPVNLDANSSDTPHDAPPVQ